MKRRRAKASMAVYRDGNPTDTEISATADTYAKAQRKVRSLARLLKQAAVKPNPRRKAKRKAKRRGIARRLV